MKRPPSRRRAREVALKVLYALESTDDPFGEVFSVVADREGLSGAPRDFAEALSSKVLEHKDELDKIIANVLEHWRIERTSRIDRLLIRMALAEYFFFPDIPPKVSIDEAVELARMYSTSQSPAFVNGVLDAIMMKGKGLGVVDALRPHLRHPR
ncbi:MAG: transcription antitermination factor NusB [Candidatus Latescibacterota bacterium]|nr:MAG: transcription antitermination factor NusB [Candidatus Latescibacterota bacterium]